MLVCIWTVGPFQVPFMTSECRTGPIHHSRRQAQQASVLTLATIQREVWYIKWTWLLAGEFLWSFWRNVFNRFHNYVASHWAVSVFQSRSNKDKLNDKESTCQKTQRVLKPPTCICNFQKSHKTFSICISKYWESLNTEMIFCIQYVYAKHLNMTLANVYNFD